MHRRIAILLLLSMLCFGRLGSIARAEIIDKIVAVVDGKIITLSDVRKEHDIRTVMGDPDMTEAELVKDLVDRALLEKEMAQFPGLAVSEEDVDKKLQEYSDLRGIPLSDIRNAIRGKFLRNTYFIQNFGQYIVISNGDIESYYKSEFVPEIQKKGLPIPELNNVLTETLRKHLFDIKLSKEVEDSLKILRERMSNEILQ